MDKLEEEFIEFFSRLFRSHGLDSLSSKIVGILYLQTEDISMEEIAEKTGYSLPSISNKMKVLENLGVVQRVKKPGTKKVYFYMEKNIVKLNINKIDAAINSILGPMEETLPPMIEKYKKKVKDEESKQKLETIENYYKQVVEFKEVLIEFRQKLEELSKKAKG